MKLNMSEDYLKNGKSLREDGYICTMDGMSRKDLIEEILGTHSHDYLVENGFIKKLEKFKRGCYFDGAFGWYNNSWRIIDFAQGLGWVWNEPIERKDMEQDMGDGDTEALVETIDEIEEWLDENTDIGENEHWCWSDGDFGLWLFDEDGEHAE